MGHRLAKAAILDAMLLMYDHVTSPCDVIRYAVAETVVMAAVLAISMVTRRRTCNMAPSNSEQTARHIHSSGTTDEPLR